MPLTIICVKRYYKKRRPGLHVQYKINFVFYKTSKREQGNPKENLVANIFWSIPFHETETSETLMDGLHVKY